MTPSKEKIIIPDDHKHSGIRTRALAMLNEPRESWTPGMLLADRLAKDIMEFAGSREAPAVAPAVPEAVPAVR